MMNRLSQFCAFCTILMILSGCSSVTDVIKSVTVLQPLKIMRIVQNAQNCESRFIICSHRMYLKVYAQQFPPLVLLPRRSALRRKDAVFHGFGPGVAYATCVFVAMQFRIHHANTPIRCGFDDYRASTPTSFRLNRSASLMLFLRPLMTNVLFSPKVDHGRGGTSLNSTNRQSVTSVSFSPRQSRTAGETSRPAPPFRLGFGRSLPKTYCQWSVRKGPASSHCAYAIRLPFRIATQRSLQVERAGPWNASLNHGTTRGASGRWPVCALSLYGSAQ